MTYIYLGLGGVIGSLFRYFLYSISISYSEHTFPYGTLAANLIGAFLLGFVTKKFSTSNKLSPQLQLAISTGAIGSFTTLSTLSTDTVQLLNQGSYLFAFLYVMISLAGGLAAVYISGQFHKVEEKYEEQR